MNLSQTILLFQASKKKYQLQGHKFIAGLSIAIENKKGTFRKGVGADGKPWKVRMPYDYGYIQNTQGVDGDEVDCFVGPAEKASKVYVVHQSKEGRNTAYDEDKVMLAFASKRQAVKAYKAAYTGVDLMMGVSTFTMHDFKIKLRNSSGNMIKAEQAALNTEDVMEPVTLQKPLTKQESLRVYNVRQGFNNALRQGAPTPVQTTNLPSQY